MRLIVLDTILISAFFMTWTLKVKIVILGLMGLSLKGWTDSLVTIAGWRPFRITCIWISFALIISLYCCLLKTMILGIIVVKSIGALAFILSMLSVRTRVVVKSSYQSGSILLVPWDSQISRSVSIDVEGVLRGRGKTCIVV